MVVVNQTAVVIDVFVLVNLQGGGFIERGAGATGTDTEPTTTTTAPPTTTTTAPPVTYPPATAPPPPPSGNYGTGDVRATVTWSGDCDLDLHVVDPSGTEIYFSNPSSSTVASSTWDIPGSGDREPTSRTSSGRPGEHPEGRTAPTSATSVAP